MKHAPRVSPPDPSGRLDLLLLRSAELVARKVEQAIGVPVWTEELAAAVGEAIDEFGIPGEPIDVEASIGNGLAEVIRAQLPKRRRRLKRSGRRQHVR